jgi:hypothetical protein
MRIIHGVGPAVVAAGLFAADYAVAAPISKAETDRAERLPPLLLGSKMGCNRGVGA